MPSLNFNFPGVSFTSSYLQAAAIVILLFLLLLSLAQFRRHFINWGIRGALFGIFFGFLLALILEGFLIIGGKTALTELIGWKKAPQPLLAALEVGRGKLVQVLGLTDEIPASTAKEKPTAESLIKFFQSLAPPEAAKVKKIICQP